MINQQLAKSIWLVSFVLTLISMTAYAHAQAAVEIEHLSIDIWPEFDSPSTLVIFRGQLADSVVLPAKLSFQLPSYISEPNAVATFTAESGLVNSQFTTSQTEGFVQLEFVVNNSGFQFEYYDPEILDSETSDRRLTFETRSAYPISDLRIEVQQPSGATEVNLLPPANAEVGGDTLTYHVLEQQNIDPGQIIALTGSYQKRDNRLTVASVPSRQQSPNQRQTDSAQATQTFQTAWILSVGGLLLLLAAGLWFLRVQPKIVPMRIRHRVDDDPVHCHRCGTARRPDAIFCHQCGSLIRDTKTSKH